MRHLRLLLLVTTLFLPVPAAGQTPSPDEFVPISEVPPSEQVPALTLVATAYGVVWLALFAYVWSLGSRLSKAEAELARLERSGS